MTLEQLRIFVAVAERFEPVFLGGIDPGEIGLAPGLVVAGAAFVLVAAIEVENRRLSGGEARFE